MYCCRLLAQLTTHAFACRPRLYPVRSACVVHLVCRWWTSSFHTWAFLLFCLTSLSNRHFCLQAARSACLSSNLEKPASPVQPMQLALSSLLADYAPGGRASSTC